MAAPQSPASNAAVAKVLRMDRRTPQIACILNSRYAPETHWSSYTAGAGRFSSAVASLLSSRDLFAGFVLYRRNENLSAPTIKSTSFLGFKAVEVSFNFRMRHELVRSVLQSALDLLAPDTSRYAQQYTPISYHQSNTLLPFVTANCPFLVTHHGPFASEVCNRFGSRLAIQAFQGSAAKVRHLIRAQAQGLRTLASTRPAVSIELSDVQAAVLRRNGISRSTVLRAGPPVQEWLARERCHHGLVHLPHLTSAHRSLHVISATARVDEFKNLSELVSAANTLVGEGTDLTLSLFIGEERDSLGRSRIQRQMADKLRARSILRPRLPHCCLQRLFLTVCHRTVFVLSSIYETLAITPIEAVLAGLPVLVPDRPETVGITEYIPSQWRYVPSAEGLAHKLRQILETPNLRAIAMAQRQFLVAHIDPMQFIDVLRHGVMRVMSRTHTGRVLARCINCEMIM